MNGGELDGAILKVQLTDEPIRSRSPSRTRARNGRSPLRSYSPPPRRGGGGGVRDRDRLRLRLGEEGGRRPLLFWLLNRRGGGGGVWVFDWGVDVGRIVDA